jgi:hypothetical protein
MPPADRGRTPPHTLSDTSRVRADDTAQGASLASECGAEMSVDTSMPVKHPDD